MAPHALLLLTPSCPHCRQVLHALTELLEEGRIARLEAVDITQEPGAVPSADIRSVPWIRIGPLEFSGGYSAAELDHWARAAAGEDGGAHAYLTDLLERGGLDRARTWLDRHPEYLPAVLDLLGDTRTPMAVRIGASALLEDLADDPRLDALLPRLAALIRAPEPQVRADAAHILSLLRSAEARPHLEALQEDPDAEVREIAAESLEKVP